MERRKGERRRMEKEKRKEEKKRIVNTEMEKKREVIAKKIELIEKKKDKKQETIKINVNESQNFVKTENVEKMSDDDRFVKIVYHQQLRGNWNEKVVPFLKIPLEKIQKSKPDDCDLSDFITAIVIEYVKKYFIHKKIEWKLLIKKSEKYLNKKSLLGKLQKIVKDLI